MGLFDKIFGRKTKPKTAGKDLPSFWEDDYSQIEIVPRKNIAHIQVSIIKIEEFEKMAWDGNGFTEIFTRDNLPFPTLSAELRVDNFEKELCEKGFEKATQIRYDGNTIIDCTSETSNAFSVPGFTFFYEVENVFISNIWISTSLLTSTDLFNKIKEALYQLGEGYDLVLVNWNSCELVDLKDRNQIIDYLMGYWK